MSRPTPFLCLALLAAERILMIHTSKGLDGVRAELKKIRPSLQHRQ